MIKQSLLLILLAILISACDWNHEDKCEWYLVPEPDHANTVEPGWVSLCARNYEINKQRCLLKAKLSFAKAVHGKPFRYSSMKIEDGRFPKEVSSIKVCTPD